MTVEADYAYLCPCQLASLEFSLRCYVILGLGPWGVGAEVTGGSGVGALRVRADHLHTQEPPSLPSLPSQHLSRTYPHFHLTTHHHPPKKTLQKPHPLFPETLNTSPKPLPSNDFCVQPAFETQTKQNAKTPPQSLIYPPYKLLTPKKTAL